MSIQDNLTIREVDFEQDVGLAYNLLFMPGIRQFVEELNNGVWPDSRYDFFVKGFKEESMRMIEKDGKTVGCFSIVETDDYVVLQRVYIAEEFQRQGIGAFLIERALEEAHNKEKPLQLEVLENNSPAVSAYKKGGFLQSSDVIVNGWNRKFEMVHKDTLRYFNEAAAKKLSSDARIEAARQKPSRLNP